MKVFPLPEGSESVCSELEDLQKGIDPTTRGVYNSGRMRDVFGDD